MFVIAVLVLAGLFEVVACVSNVGAYPFDVVDATVDASSDGGVDGARGAPVPKGKRVLGIAVDFTDLDFPRRIDVARDAGAQTTDVTFGWNEIERPYDAGVADAADDADDGGPPDAGAPATTVISNQALHVVNLVLSDRRVEATLSIEAVGLEGSRAPADLAARPLDDAQLEARYDKLLDYVFSQLPDTTLTALVVASSVDAWLTADPRRAPAFAAFVAHVATHARTLRPGLKVGFAVDPLTAAARAADLAAAWRSSDFVAFDYISGPRLGGAQPTDSDVAKMITLADSAIGTKPVLLRQAGYPSSATGGPEGAQATFVTEVFRAWDRRADRILGLVFRELDDATPQQTAALAARTGRSDPGFLTVFGSLGMHDVKYREKPAFSVLRREARARGW